MAKFLLVYHGGGMPEDPDEGARVMAAWDAWFGSLGSAIVDQGNPIAQSSTIAADGSVSAGGGANPVTGYSLIEADNLDAALDVAKRNPLLASGGSIEVAETFMPM